MSTNASTSTTADTPPEGYTPSALMHALDGATSASRLRGASDTVAAAVHACFALAGFQLVSVRDDRTGPAGQRLETANAALPGEWNATRGSYTFAYRHPESAMTYVVKAVAMGTKLLVHGMTVEENKVANAELLIGECALPESLYPVSPGDRAASTLLKGGEEGMRRSIMEPVRELVITLAPNLSKEGFQRMTTTQQTQTQGDNRDRNPRAFPQHDEPIPLPLRHPGPPPPFHPDLAPQPSPFSIGHRDLDPLGGQSPLGGSPFGGRPGGSGFGGLPPLGGIPAPFGDGGGNIMGPGHPLFTGGVGGPRGPPGFEDDPFGQGRVWGGDGYLPPGAVPPGARFDPIGPQVPPFGGPGGFNPLGPGGVPAAGRGRGRGRGRGGPPGPFSGEPDNDELPPPGSQDTFM
ncbi:hypothetical protein H9P43_007198 [Blastocladiella emersonii ATCC 22665]|nr:hypothetical protein H9P43_007198 [Blastocladiella emersonii ATCC 22665]